MQVTSQEILVIEGLSHDGRGIARLAPEEDADNARGLTVFVQGALPGQTVRAHMTQRKKNWASAVCEGVLEQAPDATPPLCPHYATCGGCPLQTMPYPRQLFYKEDIVRQALTRIGRFSPEDVSAAWQGMTPSPELKNFRNKLALAFGTDADGGPSLGLRAEASHTVTPVPQCALVPVKGMAIAARLLELVRAQWEEDKYGAAAGADDAFWRFLILRRGHTAAGADAWWAVCLTGPGNKSQRRTVRRVGEDLLTVCPQLAGFIHEERRQQDMLAVGERRVCALGDVTMHLPLAGHSFALDATSFFQVNTQAAQQLAAHATAMLASYTNKGYTLLDCYCGVGAPGLCVAPGFARVLGVEAQTTSAAHATQNARSAGLTHCQYVARDAARAMIDWAKEVHDDQCVALLDPPRAGLDAGVLAALCRIKPLVVLYISCNPATLARDAAGLAGVGYRLDQLRCVDLFPHTAHVESLARFIRTT